jgi:hypothetical protein
VARSLSVLLQGLVDGEWSCLSRAPGEGAGAGQGFEVCDANVIVVSRIKWHDHLVKGE